MDEETALKTLPVAVGLAVEIGPFYGSVACFSYKDADGAEGRIQAIKFERERLPYVWKRIQENIKTDIPVKIMGNRSKKYFSFFDHESTSIAMSLMEEEDVLNKMMCGFDALLRNVENEVYFYEPPGRLKFFRFGPPVVYPCFLIILEDTTRIIKVDSTTSYQVIDSTAIGGCTLFTLASLLTSAKGLNEILKMSKGEWPTFDSFEVNDGIFKPFAEHFEAYLKGQPHSVSESDSIMGILWMIWSHIAQIISLQALRYDIDKVFIVSSSMDGCNFYSRSLSDAIAYSSKGMIKPMFLRHESFLGVVGLFMRELNPTDYSKSWFENYACSSGTMPEDEFMFGKIKIAQLTIDCCSESLIPCPLLKNVNEYFPDTVDLAEDRDAREYWCKCIEENIRKRLEQKETNSSSKKSFKKINKYKDIASKKIQYLCRNPYGFGGLSLRMIHEMLDHFKAELDIKDIYKQIKSSENTFAFTQFKSRLQEIDEMSFKERHLDLLTTILVGNILDWGSGEAVSYFTSKNFNIHEEKAILPKRPWLIDSVNMWIERMKGPHHTTAAIFVDNSGVDVILGIVPFARELIRRGTKVLLCANSLPTLNDVTYKDLKDILREAGKFCPVINEAVLNNFLIPIETGQRGPCLDLSRLHARLAKLMSDVDLVCIEGMGRAIHTNLNAEFLCETLKIGIIKDKWLAAKFGGQCFSPICKFEICSKNL